MDARGPIAVKKAIHKMAHAFASAYLAKIGMVIPIVQILVRRKCAGWTGRERRNA